MNTQLAEHLIETGLIQFGNFNGIPFRFNFHLLPSYPDLLHQIGQEFYHQINQHPVERLVCVADAISTALVVSQQSQIPLVYSRGNTEAPVFDLVGAYDVGHPTAMFVHVIEDTNILADFVKRAESVGLRIEVIYGIITLNKAEQGSSIPKIFTLFDFNELLDYLVENDHLTAHHKLATKKWLDTR